MHYPNHLLKLIHILRRLPGVGNKSAERFAFHLCTCSTEQLLEMGSVISEIKKHLQECPQCGCLTDSGSCHFCQSSGRDPHVLCVIASLREVYAMEETREFKGLYHVLGGLISPLDKRGPEHLSIRKLKERLNSLPIQEVIIALDSTLEGDATALFLKQELSHYPLRISRIAFGMPMGSSIDYVDGGTLARALSGRAQF